MLDGKPLKVVENAFKSVVLKKQRNNNKADREQPLLVSKDEIDVDLEVLDCGIETR